MYQAAEYGGWISLVQWEPRLMNKITRESAVKLADKPCGWSDLLMFQMGRDEGAWGVRYEPRNCMWAQYDYLRGYDVGEVMFEEANGQLLEGDDE